MATSVENNVYLSDFTSFGVGGPAANFVVTKNTDELLEILKANNNQKLQVIGYGSNVLISDKGLQGLVISNRGGSLKMEGEQLVVDSGVWWDEVVRAAIEHKLWGIELLSEIPGSVGGALFINIAAYGQSIGKVVDWVDVWDNNNQNVINLTSEELIWGYKSSIFQNNNSYIILRAGLNLSKEKTDELVYQKALDTAGEFGLDINSLEDRRKIIIHTREKAGSIWHVNDSNYAKTVGSFFRNPEVTEEQAQLVMSFDESGKSKNEIQNMNRVHGGTSNRVSAAHVMLACGFKRGQTWKNVKLNDQNLLKIEALAGATAQEIYDVVAEIQKTCVEKLGITLEAEAQIMGEFTR